MSRRRPKNVNRRTMDAIDTDPLRWTRRVRCHECGAAMPILERDADGFVECFCGARTATAPTRAIAEARRHIDNARKAAGQ